MSAICAIPCKVVALRLSKGTRANRRTLPVGVKGLGGDSEPRSAHVTCSSHNKVPLALEMGNGGDSGGNFSSGNNGNSGNNNWGNNGDDLSNGDENRYRMGYLVALPVYDIASTFGGSVTIDQILVLVAALLIPALGVYLHTKRTNKAFWIAVPLTFLPPVGVLYALFIIYGNGARRLRI